MRPLVEHSKPEAVRVTARDGVALSVRWDRVEGARGVALIAHGFAEYSRRQEHLARALVSGGWDVLRYDMRGHGHSGGRRGHVERFSDYVDDLVQMVGLARVEGLPLCVIGHSQGGLITATGLCAGKLDVDAVVLTNPALQQAFQVPGWKVAAARWLSKALPKVSLPTGLSADDLSSNPEANRDYAQDPMIFDGGTTRWGWEYLTAQRSLAEQVLSTSTPTLVALGMVDPIIDARATQQWLSLSRSTSLSVLTYEGLKHELSNELPTDRDQVFADILSWLTQQTSGGQER